MKKIYNKKDEMNLKKISKKKYLEFSKYDGSHHIASEHAIHRILQLVKKENAKNVLEIGLGIGTIYSAVRKHNKKIKYFGTEDNDFCLKSLKKNLKDDYASLTIFDSIERLSFMEKFDIIIIDGKDSSLTYLENYIDKNGVIIIEGDRSNQEKEILKLFPNAINVHIISLFKNNSCGVFNSSHYQCGVKVIYINPTFNQKLNWSKQKFFTKIKYTLRILKN